MIHLVLELCIINHKYFKSNSPELADPVVKFVVQNIHATQNALRLLVNKNNCMKWKAVIQSFPIGYFWTCICR